MDPHPLAFCHTLFTAQNSGSTNGRCGEECAIAINNSTLTLADLGDIWLPCLLSLLYC